MLSPTDLLADPEALAWLRERAAIPDISRYRLARETCEHFDWRDALGRFKEMACRKALGALAHCGLITLPAKRYAPPTAHPLPPIEAVPIEATLAELGEIKLVAVSGKTPELSRLWYTLMQAHPLGGGPLVGAQIRYLIGCERGWLGALAFSASARRLRARDTWLGWDDKKRQANLDRIVANSRFLILPGVRVPHLASHVLAQVCQQLPEDWTQRYGFAPWLIETFVDSPHSGTCYRAAGWNEIGTSQGRGRQDATNQFALSRKRLFVKLLEPARFEIRAPLTAPLTDWAQAEFATVKLEPRLLRRAITIARDFFARPMAQIPQACETWARAKAAYRFFANPKVTMQTLLTGHYHSSIERCQHEPLVLAVCDSSALNYTAHPLTSGLGPIGSHKEGPIGLWLHETMAFTPSGVPLGLIDVQCWARDKDTFGIKHARKQRPIEEKESHKWLDSWAATCRAQEQSPNTQFVMVADRESDVFELLVQARGQRAQLLIRAEQSRKLLDEELCLWPFMQTQPFAGELKVHAGRCGDQPARIARLAVRYAKVTLNAPAARKHLGTVTVWAVWAQEIDAPSGIAPLDWMLLSTVPTETFEHACERLDWYAKRWGIEIFHRILKSGCNIEDRQLTGADRLEACLAIDMVVAWRVMHLVHLNREVPQLPATVYFDDMQWRALVAYATRNPNPPYEPPTLGEAVRMLSRLGGHLKRKHDGEPGAETLWRSLQRLDDITRMYSVFTDYLPLPIPPPTG
jgi:hypothetical protein